MFSKNGVFTKEIEEGIQELLNYQNDDGGFQAEKPNQDRSGVYPTADTLFLISRYLDQEVLKCLKREKKENVLRGCFRWLMKVRNNDGGWSQYAISKNDRSVVDSTAWVVRALVAYTRTDKIPKNAWEYLRRLLTDTDVCNSFIARMEKGEGIVEKEREGDDEQKRIISWLLENLESEHILEILKILLARRAIEWLMNNQNEDSGWGLFKGEDSRVYSTFISLVAIQEFISRVKPLSQGTEEVLINLKNGIEKGEEWLQRDEKQGGCRRRNGWTYCRKTDRNTPPDVPNVPSTCQALIALLSNDDRPDLYKSELNFLIESFERGSKEVPKKWGTEEELYRLSDGFDVRLSWFTLPFVTWALTFFVKASMLSITDFLRVLQYLRVFVTEEGKVGLYPGGTEVRTWAVCHYLIAFLEAREMIQGDKFFMEKFTEFTTYPDIVEDVHSSKPARFFPGYYASNRFLNFTLCLGTIAALCAITIVAAFEGISALPYLAGVVASAGVVFFLKSLTCWKLGHSTTSRFLKVQASLSAMIIGTPLAICQKIWQDAQSPLSLLSLALILVGLICPVTKVIEDLQKT